MNPALEADLSDEARAILALVDRFCTRAVDPRAARPEAPMSPAALAEILAAAREIGILPGEDPGVGLWEGDPEGAARSVAALVRLARANAGVALAAHQIAAADRMRRALGIGAIGGGVLAVEGRLGIGRGALGRYLAGGDLDEDDRALLGDVLDPTAPRILTTHPDFAWILAPVMRPSGLVGWARLDRAALSITTHDHPHGFDELVTISFAPTGAPAILDLDLDAEASSDRLAEALSVMSLGLVSVALGSAQRAHALAAGYAGTRRQGGKLIADHAAVGALLASSRSAILTVEAQIEAITRRPLALERSGLPHLLALRAEAHPILGRGVNDALQVFGGMGYMRDTGAEKALRDVNHLRVIGGSPMELSLVQSAWERASG